MCFNPCKIQFLTFQCTFTDELYNKVNNRGQMVKLIECVPNFSEGRDKDKIAAITSEISAVEGVKLLDVDPGADTNRTVVTFIGEPSAVEKAAFHAIKKAAEIIDMAQHSGAHARLGATDVCPLVPVRGVTVDECVEIANRLGKRIGEELKIPVFMYEYAAKSPQRQNLAEIRKGEYEGLAEKLQLPDWLPDYGPSKFDKQSGATVIGVREFLIAYNVNLNTRNRKLAHEIALNIREAGRAKRDSKGNIIRDENGNAIMVPGTLKACKAVGWYIDEYKQAQVSINLVNYKITPPHVAFDEVAKHAEKLGLRVTGSELVGLIPLQAMLEAGRYYLSKQKVSTAVPEKELIRVAVESMGLEDITSFDPAKKIIEYSYQSDERLLGKMSVIDFTDELSTDSPAPGGGSVAALIGSLGAALSSMVANLTIGKKEYESSWQDLQESAIHCQEAKDYLLYAIDYDTRAFNRLMAAFSIPKNTDEQKELRLKAIEEATKGAIDVPLGVMEKCVQVTPYCKTIAEKGNLNAISDAGVAALALSAATESAALNVRINLKSVEDTNYVIQTREKTNTLLESVKIGCNEILNIIEEKL